MIHSRLGSPPSSQGFEEDYSTSEFELYEDDDGNGVPHAMECKDEPTPITYDTCIGAEVVLPKGNDMVSGTVKSRVKDFEGQPIGEADKNPILDTWVYKVEFSDGENAELGANIIAECMYAQCDIECNQYSLMDHSLQGQPKCYIEWQNLQTEDHKRMATLHRVEGQVNFMGKIE